MSVTEKSLRRGSTKLNTDLSEGREPVLGVWDLATPPSSSAEAERLLNVEEGRDRYRGETSSQR